MPTCDVAEAGGLCEADGECGTNVELNNCGDGYDVYRKVLLPSYIDERRVTGLKLRFNNLTGVVPPELGLATHLQQVLLNDNEISGSVPSTLRMLTALYVLSLSDNSISGTIPDLFSNGSAWVGAECGGHLGRARSDCDRPSIYLSGNSISGTLPTEVRSKGNLLRVASPGPHC